jgi:hypothetical protein
MEMLMSIRWLLPAPLAIMAVTPAPVFAQYSYYSSGSFMFNQNNYPDVTGATYRAREADSKPSSRQTTTRKPTSQTSSPTTRPSAALAMNNALPYIRDKALSSKIRSEFLVDLAGRGSISDVTQMAKMMAQYDFVQVYAGMARLQGMDSSSPDSLIALWYGQTWAIANQKPLPPARQYQAIAKQMRDTKANSGKWATMTNRARQSFIEGLAYAFIIQKANYQAYRREGKTAALADMAQKVQDGMVGYGINMRTTKLTDAGLIE